MKGMAPEIREAYRSWRRAISLREPGQGNYDRPHGENVSEGKRWAKLEKLIRREGLDLAFTLARLSNEEDEGDRTCL